MKSIRLSVTLASLAFGLCFGTPAAATTMVPEQFTCPIGGEKFEGYVIGSYSSWGQRPDGRTYGTLPIYPLIECPGNGFILFQEKFTEEEIAILTPLVASEAYQALRRSETSYHRLWWLLGKLGRSEADLADALLVASWETEDDPARKARYQHAYVEAAKAVPATDNAAWFNYNLRAANALRELGRFDEASALLKQVDGSANWPSDKEEREAARFLIDGLAVLITEKNPYAEPANLIPADIAVERCQDADAALSPAERAACATPDYQTAIEKRREYEAQASAQGGDTSAKDEADAMMAEAEANLEAADAAVEAAAIEAGDAIEEADCYEDGDTVTCSIALPPDIE